MPSSPSSPSSAGRKSPVDRPRRYRIGITSPTFGDRLAYAGRILELNRSRSPVSSSTRLSFTRGARTGIVPDPTVTRRCRARPLRTTSRRPSSSSSPLNRSTYSSASARSAAAIIRRAPSRASSSSASVISSLPSPTGSVRAFVIGVPSFSAFRWSVLINREGTPPSPHRRPQHSAIARVVGGDHSLPHHTNMQHSRRGSGGAAKLLLADTTSQDVVGLMPAREQERVSTRRVAAHVLIATCRARPVVRPPVAETTDPE